VGTLVLDHLSQQEKAMGEIVYHLRNDGITSILPNLFNPEPVYSWLSTKTVYNAHVAAKGTQSAPFGNPVVDTRWPMFCFSMEDIVTAPVIFELALRFIPYAREYFEEDQLLYSMNCFCTQPASGPEYADTHWWHIDGDDRKQMVVFFMLTDIPTPMDGAHLYQKTSHTYDGKVPWEWTKPPEDKLTIVTGKAGDVFVEDPRGFHMAYRPRYKKRMMVWARFGVSDPPESYKWDRLSPISKDLLGDRYPKDETVQKVIRLVVA
jgi:hypothetical protein